MSGRIASGVIGSKNAQFLSINQSINQSSFLSVAQIETITKTMKA